MEWSIEERAAFLKFSSQYNAVPGEYGGLLSSPVGANSYSVALGDVDGDGDLDLVAGVDGFSNWVYLYDSAAGTYGNPINFGTGSDPTTSVAFGDVDRDGDLDIAVGNTGLQSAVYLYDSGAGTYGNPVNFGTGLEGTQSVAFGDVDRDGDLDIAVGNDTEQNVIYRYNSAAGTYGNPMDFGTGSEDSRAVVFGDLDGDGDLGIATGNHPEQNAVYFLGGAYNLQPGLVQSLKVNDTLTGITDATLVATDTQNTTDTRNTSIRYYLSNDGGLKWYQVSSGTSFAFPSPGDDLRWKAERTSLSSAVSPKIETIAILDDTGRYDAATAEALRNSFGTLDVNDDGVLSLAESGLVSQNDLDVYDDDGDGDVTMVDLLELTVGPVGVATTVYVNFSNAGTEDGATPATGFNSLFEAAAFVADSGTVSISAGSSSETISLQKAMTIVATGGTARIGGSP